MHISTPRNPMVPSPALQVQEICDYIADFLHESPADLKSCALVSQPFTSSAQRHLFREINLGVDLALGTTSAASKVAHRFGSILLESPHLVHFIRHLVVSFDLESLTHVASVQFTHLDSLLFYGTRDTPQSGRTVSLAARLSSLPSLRRLKIWCITFEDLDSLRALFHLRVSALTYLSLHDVEIISLSGPHADLGAHRITLAGLELNASSTLRQDPAWLVHPLSPFDFSALTAIDIARATSPGVTQVMRCAPLLHTLRINALDATGSFSLAAFPGLKKIEMFGGFGGGGGAAALLASLGPDNHLEELRIRIAVTGSLDGTSLRRLDATISGRLTPALRTVEIVLLRSTLPWSSPGNSEEFALRMRTLRSSFPNLNARGCLGLSYLIDGIRTYV
ncbi:hypothetical protein DFH09DRAFT_1192527 [Mycena vulgaris]|nr:hypothetical protein DFH09DRAFT_1192527 [Mycena vulgaris]